MRKVSILVLGVLTMSALFFSAYKLHDYKEQIAILTEQLESIESEPKTTHSGGAETTPVEPSSNTGEFVFPVSSDDFLYYSSPYGLRVSPILNIEMKHEGLDIAGVWRSQVVAIADGVVLEHWPPPDGYYRGHPIYGGYLVIDHGDTVSAYAHLAWTRVHQGMEVRAGEVIGRIGDTGVADGNHLHFELHMNGETVNPLLYLPEPK